MPSPRRVMTSLGSEAEGSAGGSYADTLSEAGSVLSASYYSPSPLAASPSSHLSDCVEVDVKPLTAPQHSLAVSMAWQVADILGRREASHSTRCQHRHRLSSSSSSSYSSPLEEKEEAPPL